MSVNMTIYIFSYAVPLLYTYLLSLLSLCSSLYHYHSPSVHTPAGPSYLLALII